MWLNEKRQSEVWSGRSHLHPEHNFWKSLHNLLHSTAAVGWGKLRWLKMTSSQHKQICSNYRISLNKMSTVNSTVTRSLMFHETETNLFCFLRISHVHKPLGHSVQFKMFLPKENRNKCEMSSSLANLEWRCSEVNCTGFLPANHH